MKSVSARCNDATPNKISFDKHSPLTDRTQRHENSNSDCAPGVESVLYPQPLTSPGIASRTSCRGHPMHTDADSGILTPPRSHSAPSVAAISSLLRFPVAYRWRFRDLPWQGKMGSDSFPSTA